MFSCSTLQVNAQDSVRNSDPETMGFSLTPKGSLNRERRNYGSGGLCHNRDQRDIGFKCIGGFLSHRDTPKSSVLMGFSIIIHP